MKEQLEEIRARALAELADGASEAQIENVRVRVLGRAGELTDIMRRMREVPNAEKPAMGRLVNEIKGAIEARIEELTAELARAAMERSLAEARLDVTLPGMEIPRGWLHPITLVTQRMLDIFTAMGFEVVETQDIEDDFHNFSKRPF